MKHTQARNWNLQVIDQWIATSCDEHGGYEYDSGRRSPRYYGLDGCEECDRKGIAGLYDVPEHKRSGR